MDGRHAGIRPWVAMWGELLCESRLKDASRSTSGTMVRSPFRAKVVTSGVSREIRATFIIAAPRISLSLGNWQPNLGPLVSGMQNLISLDRADLKGIPAAWIPPSILDGLATEFRITLTAPELRKGYCTRCSCGEEATERIGVHTVDITAPDDPAPTFIAYTIGWMQCSYCSHCWGERQIVVSSPYTVLE